MSPPSTRKSSPQTEMSTLESHPSPPPDPESPVPSTRVVRSQCQDTPQQLFYRVKKEITSISGPAYIEWEGIAPEAGYQVARSLCEDGEIERRNVTISFDPTVGVLSTNMPTQIHDSALSWVVMERERAVLSGFFTLAELGDLDLLSNARFDNFPPPWANIYKEPDAAFRFSGTAFPSVVIESGLSESWHRLLRDRTLWLQGGAPHVNAVLLVKWVQRVNGRIAGYLEVHRRGGGTSPRLQIFPAPPPGTPSQYVTWYRRDFYPGGLVPSRRNGGDTWLWSIDNLRTKAARAMASEGSLVPA